MAQGQMRVLHLDSHNSHTNLEFDDYAAEHNIIILGYPPHCTHALQGLDVVHFGRMKSLWPKAIRAFEEREHIQFSKSNFLPVLHQVFEEVFTPKNNRAAFKLTGISDPSNPDIIKEWQTAPSEETSVRSSHPVPPPTPVRKAGRFLDVLEEIDWKKPVTSVVARDMVRKLVTVASEFPTRKDVIATSKTLEPILEQPLTTESQHGPPASAPESLNSEERLKEIHRLQKELNASRTTVSLQASTIRAQNAQLLIKTEHCRGLQKRLHTKKGARKETHVKKYFKRGGLRVYTDPAFRAALRADKADGFREDLGRIKRAMVTAAKADRTRWRAEEKITRDEKNAINIAEYDASVEECTTNGKKQPKKPKRIQKERTPDRYANKIEEMENLGEKTLTRFRNEEPEIAAKKVKKGDTSGRRAHQRQLLDAIDAIIANEDISEEDRPCEAANESEESSEDDMDIDEGTEYRRSVYNRCANYIQPFQILSSIKNPTK